VVIGSQILCSTSPNETTRNQRGVDSLFGALEHGWIMLKHLDQLIGAALTSVVAWH
jgi:hypothetical protein